MKKTSYKAIATLNENGNTFDVVIFSDYKSVEEAEDGIKRFALHGYNILRTKVEKI